MINALKKSFKISGCLFLVVLVVLLLWGIFTKDSEAIPIYMILVFGITTVFILSVSVAMFVWEMNLCYQQNGMTAFYKFLVNFFIAALVIFSLNVLLKKYLGIKEIFFSSFSLIFVQKALCFLQRK